MRVAQHEPFIAALLMSAVGRKRNYEAARHLPLQRLPFDPEVKLETALKASFDRMAFIRS